jgi:hypothetical protein
MPWSPPPTNTTSRGVPLVSLLLTFVVGLIVLAAMRREIPDQERPFRLPGGDILPFIAFYAANLIVYWAGWNTNGRRGRGREHRRGGVLAGAAGSAAAGRRAAPHRRRPSRGGRRGPRAGR